MENITITLKEYTQLEKDSETLRALEWTGVDNWEGWDIAMDLLEEWNKENKETNNEKII